MKKNTLILIVFFVANIRSVFSQTCFATQTYTTVGATTYTLSGTAANNYTIKITCDGGAGAISSLGNIGGKGARMSGIFTVSGGDVLRVVVGANGSFNLGVVAFNGGGGGGGGSAVIRCTGGGVSCTSGTLFIAASGGGGGGNGVGGGGLTTSGSGNGGAGNAADSGGGGGLNSAGTGTGAGGQVIITGTGVSLGGNTQSDGGAGFGGGGGGATSPDGICCFHGGGGGGYSGGDAGGSGGGGSSYNAGSSQVNTSNIATVGRVTIECLTVLATELMGFKATNHKSTIDLLWQTASEKDMSHFDIEQSTDGLNFSKIGETKAAGKANSYTFTKEGPLSIVTYFRLKIVNSDGRFTYSKVLSVAFGKDLTVKAFPNPIQNELTIDVISESKQLDIDIIDVLGRSIYQKNESNTDLSREYREGSKLLTINTLKWLSGIYFLKISDGKKVFQQKIVKR
jgi:hypothetical protein